MIELTAGGIALAAAGLTAQEAADAVKVLGEVGISHDRLTLTQSIATAVVADQPQQLAPEGVGATFLGRPVEWFSRPQWEHHFELSECDYELRTGVPCVLPAYHEVPPLSIPHAAADEFPESEPDWPAKDFSWSRAANPQGAAPCGDEHGEEYESVIGRNWVHHRCVLPMGHGLHAVSKHTDHPEGPDAPEAYVWF